VRAGLSDSAAYFFRGSRNGRRFCAEICARRRRSAVQKARAGVKVELALERGAGIGKQVSGVSVPVLVAGPAIINALLPSLRESCSPTEVISLRFRVFRYTTFPHGRSRALTALFLLCIALGPWLIAKLRRISDRPIHPRGRPENRIRKRPGRPPWAACSLSSSIVISDTALGRPAPSFYVWIAMFSPGDLCSHRVRRRLRQGHEEAQPSA